MERIKNILYSVLLMGICSCGYTEQTSYELRNMRPPVILVSKEKLTFWYGVTLQDSTMTIYRFGNMSSIARVIGRKYNVGDTIPTL